MASSDTRIYQDCAYGSNFEPELRGMRLFLYIFPHSIKHSLRRCFRSCSWLPVLFLVSCLNSWASTSLQQSC